MSISTEYCCFPLIRTQFAKPFSSCSQTNRINDKDMFSHILSYGYQSFPNGGSSRKLLDSITESFGLILVNWKQRYIILCGVINFICILSNFDNGKIMRAIVRILDWLRSVTHTGRMHQSVSVLQNFRQTSLFARKF